MGPYGVPLRGVDGAPDQVLRLRAFRRSHPEWHIQPVGREWVAHRTGEVHHRPELRDLLDLLEGLEES